MMRGNLALTGDAAGGLIGRPGCAGKRRVQQNHHEQADACRKGTVAMVTRNVHVARKPEYVARHYSVKRHSLQAGSSTRPLTSYTIRQSCESLTRRTFLAGTHSAEGL